MKNRNGWSLLVAGALWMSLAAHAASTIDFADQWYEGNGASGWGASVQQQNDVLFVAVYVYDTDHSPTWFTAAAYLQGNAPPGHTVFAGDLYLSNGTYYGDPNGWMDVTYSKVGRLVFDAAEPNAAVLTYNVGITQVVKAVTRQTWRYENLTGRYVGAARWDCAPGAPVAGRELAGMLDIAHDATTQAVTMCFDEALPCWLGEYLLKGTYSQEGHIGRIVGGLQAPDEGSVVISEIDTSSSGFTARLSGTINGCKVANGRLAAARQ